MVVCTRHETAREVFSLHSQLYLLCRYTTLTYCFIYMLGDNLNGGYNCEVHTFAKFFLVSLIQILTDMGQITSRTAIACQ